MSIDYADPVAKLLTYGSLSMSQEPWANYVDELGLTQADVPELIRLAVDPGFNELDSDRVEVWAPVHAWRALAQLKAVDAIEPLLGLLATEDDWVLEEMPEVFGQLGTAAIPALTTYLTDVAQNEWARIAVADGLRHMAEADPTSQDAVVNVLTEQLKLYADNGGNLNSTLINNLVMLEAVETAPLIEAAFATGEIDEFLTGSWASIQVELGLKQETDFSPEELKATPPPHIAVIQQNIEKVRKMFQMQERQITKPQGFGAALPFEPKKNKKKKKK